MTTWQEWVTIGVGALISYVMFNQRIEKAASVLHRKEQDEKVTKLSERMSLAEQSVENEREKHEAFNEAISTILDKIEIKQDHISEDIQTIKLSLMKLTK